MSEIATASETQLELANELVRQGAVPGFVDLGAEKGIMTLNSHDQIVVFTVSDEPDSTVNLELCIYENDDYGLDNPIQSVRQQIADQQGFANALEKLASVL